MKVNIGRAFRALAPTLYVALESTFGSGSKRRPRARLGAEEEEEEEEELHVTLIREWKGLSALPPPLFQREF